ncbi:hypothetical protein C8A00DRAFT_32168 [Chaetomidium leptoderma]|uniref:Uncharacterized protein n=1 Tax=Chaetomidium leptoderma TaxID=669021 RepID=A0AAN6VQF8_9PEZI|nr:hypothetical protein C8A00DRAFT_32168 [Chaetomidium leptoderma]
MAELYGLRKSIDRLFGRFYYGGPKAPKVLAAKVRCWEQLQTVIFAPASAYWAGDLGAGLGAWLEELKHGYANQPQWAQAITADFNLGVLHEHRARAAIVLLRIEDGVSVVRDAQAVADIFTGYIVDLGWGIDRVPKAEWEEFLERAVPVVQKAGELDRLFRLSRCDYRLASNVEQATTGKTASPPAGLAHYGLFKCGDPGVYTYDVTPIEVVPVKRACDWRY